MNAGKILINGIFNSSRLLEIPFYQRSYVWKEDQWERFLQDMEFVTKTRRPYFLGSLILKGSREPNTWDNFSDCKVVIDGQQRLTTLMIFFKVLCLKIGENSSFDRDFRLEDDTIALQHGRNDIDAFQKVVNAKEAKRLENSQPASQIISAFNYFIDKLNPDNLNRKVIKQNIQFVCIDLLEDEDEQQIFDTINSLGVRLTTSELLKNYFYSKDNVQEYDENWVPVFEKDSEARLYWEQELETGRVKRSLIDIFFDAYFQLFIQNKQYNVSGDDKICYARLDRLSKSYQDFIDHYCDGDKSVILKPMADCAKRFAEVFRPEYCDMSLPAKSSIERINVIIFGLKTSTLIPYILFVAINVSDVEERNRIFGVLESYIMRRMVVHATSNNYNRLFTSLILNGVTDADLLKERLVKGDDATTYVPANDELQKGFHSSKLVNLQARGILYMIESGIRPAHSAVSLMGFDNYSLEHLLPKKWRNHWDRPASSEAVRQRDSMLLTLGNLAIIPQSLNTSIRDGDWETKKAGKGNTRAGLSICAAGLATMYDVLQKSVWNEMEIQQRADWLYEKASELWNL